MLSSRPGRKAVVERVMNGNDKLPEGSIEKGYQVFGDELNKIIGELNGVLAA